MPPLTMHSIKPEDRVQPPYFPALLILLGQPPGLAPGPKSQGWSWAWAHSQPGHLPAAPPPPIPSSGWRAFSLLLCPRPSFFCDLKVICCHSVWGLWREEARAASPPQVWALPISTREGWERSEWVKGGADVAKRYGGPSRPQTDLHSLYCRREEGSQDAKTKRTDPHRPTT